jgi:hypothetical protein
MIRKKQFWGEAPDSYIESNEELAELEMCSARKLSPQKLPSLH